MPDPRNHGWAHVARRVLIAVAVLVLPVAAQQATPPRGIAGLSLESTEDEVEAWIASKGFQLQEDGWYQRTSEEGRTERFSYTPADGRIERLILSHRDLGKTVFELYGEVMRRYGQPVEGGKTEHGYRMVYRMEGGSMPGRFVVNVMPGTLMYDLVSDRAQQEYDAGQRNTWLIPLVAIVAAILLLLAAPEKVRRPVFDAVAFVVSPLLTIVGFVTSRAFTLLMLLAFGPFFVLSGCAVGLAIDHDVSWWWSALWLLGVIFAWEAKTEGDMRFMALANLTFLGVFLGVYFDVGGDLQGLKFWD